MMTAPGPVSQVFPDLVLGADTSYTLWSKGRLLGQSELDYVRCFPKHRAGDFYPTELGEKLMPVVTGVRLALLDLARTSAERRDRGDAQRDRIERLDAIRNASEFADVSAAQAQFDALELQLRAPDGSIVPTKWVDVRDTELTLSFAREDDYVPPDPLFAETEEEKQLLASMGHDAALLEEWFGPDWDCDETKPWEEAPSFPRYQIQVELLDDSAVP